MKQIIFFVLVFFILGLAYSPDVSACGTINSGGDYNLINDITTTTLPCLTISASNVNFNGNNYLIWCQSSSATYCISISNTNVNISNIRINYTSALSTAGQSGIRILTTGGNSFLRNITINASVSRYIYGIFLSVGNNHVINNYTFNGFSSNSPYAVYISAGTGNIINNTRCSLNAGSNAGACIYIASGGHIIDNSNFTIQQFSNGIFISNILEGTTILNTNISSQTSYALNIQNQGNMIRNTRATSTTVSALYMSSSNSNNISNSFFNVSNSGVYSIYLSNSNHNNISGCNLSGLLLDSSNHTNITNSYFFNSAGYKGVYSSNAVITRVENNIFNYTIPYDGILFYAQNNSIIRNNTIYNCGSPNFHVNSITNSYYVVFANNFLNTTCTSGLGLAFGYDTDTVLTNGIHSSIVENNTVIAPPLSSGTLHTMFFGAINSTNIRNMSVSGGFYGILLKNVINSNLTNANISNSNYSFYIKSGENITVRNVNISSTQNILMVLNLDKNTSFSYYPYPTNIILHNFNISANGPILITASNNILINNTFIRNSSIGVSNTIYFKLSNSILNSTILGINLSNSNYSIIQNNIINTTSYSYTLSAPSRDNYFFNNSIRSNNWIFDNGINNQNFYNTTYIGNKYYFANGQNSYDVLDLVDTDGDQQADSGANYPLNSTTAPSNWFGNGTDFRPFTLKTPPSTIIVSYSPNVYGIMFNPLLPTSKNVPAINQSQWGIFNISAIGGTPQIKLKLNESLANIKIFCNNNSNIATATVINAITPTVIYTHTYSPQYIWCWANFSNPPVMKKTFKITVSS